MKKQILVFALLLSFGAVSVSAQEHTQTQEQQAITQHKVEVQFQEKLAGLYTSSLPLTEAFVASDSYAVKKQLAPLKEAMEAVDMRLLKGQAHADWMMYAKAMLNSITAMNKSQTIADQRKAYAQFSEKLYQSIKAFGINHTEAYYQHCPMALGNKGAFWLSDKKEIQNPYFGKAMLKCGRTKEKIGQ